MDRRPILFFDSGMGGLPYCRHFHGRNPAEPLIYAADRANFPYGPKDRETLVEICGALVERIRARFNPKLAAVVCNTASVSALEELRRRFPDLPLVGTVPAVKPAVLASRNRHIGVLGTSRTIEDPYIPQLAARYGAGCRVTGIAAPELVDFVERRYEEASGEERRRRAAEYIERFRAAGVDAVVLGCTHFLFLLDDFRAAAPPGMGIYDSVEGVSRRIETLLDEGGLCAAGPGGSGESLLALTGLEPPGGWERRAASLGFRLCLLDAGEEGRHDGSL